MLGRSSSACGPLRQILQRKRISAFGGWPRRRHPTMSQLTHYRTSAVSLPSPAAGFSLLSSRALWDAPIAPKRNLA